MPLYIIDILVYLKPFNTFLDRQENIKCFIALSRLAVSMQQGGKKETHYWRLSLSLIFLTRISTVTTETAPVCFISLHVI